MPYLASSRIKDERNLSCQ